jgi:hypothetical protein
VAVIPETPSPRPKVKRAVPPSPTSHRPTRGDEALASSLLDNEAIEEIEDGDSQSGSSYSSVSTDGQAPPPTSHRLSRRDEALRCPMLDNEAIEENEDGDSQSGSDYSSDDQDMLNMSYVTEGTCINSTLLFYNKILVQALAQMAIPPFTMQAWEAKLPNTGLVPRWLVQGEGFLNLHTTLLFV